MVGGFVIVTVLLALLAITWNLHYKMSAVGEAIFRLQREHVGRRDFASRFDGANHLLSLTSPNKTSKAEHQPHIVLDGILKPGHCWSFDGSKGQIGIQLTESIAVSHITIDHAPKELVAHLNDAPRTVRVWGTSKNIHDNNYHPVREPVEGPQFRDPAYSFVLLGTVHYDISASDHIQTYSLSPLGEGKAFQTVVVEFVDNWGAGSTCIYRVRIHGDPVRGGPKRSEIFVG